MNITNSEKHIHFLLPKRAIFLALVDGEAEVKEYSVRQFTELITKPMDLPPAGTLSKEHSCRRLPFTANGHFYVPQELYQSHETVASCEAAL